MHLDHTQTAATAAYLEASNGHSRLVALSLALGDDNYSHTLALWSSDGGHCQLNASTPTTDCITLSPCWSCVWAVGSGRL